MEQSGIRKLVAENTDAMLAYWDADQVCRYANNAYIKWFGKTPGEMIDKITLQELLKDIYPKNLPYIEKVLQGETQVFYRDIKVPSGEIRRAIATYHPDIEHGLVKGFFVHVADMGVMPNKPVNRVNEPESQFTIDAKMQDIAEFLKAEIFNGFPGLREIAKKHFISVSKLKRDFTHAYHSSPMVYYRNLQMEYAAEYLKENKTSKKKLASLLNFSNPSNFSNYFRRFIDDVGRDRQQAIIKRESQHLNKIFIEQTPFAIAMFDLNMNYLAASGQWIADHGLEAIELPGKLFFDVNPLLGAELKQICTQCLAGSVNKCDAYFWRKTNNEYVWLKWDIRPWYIYAAEIGGILVFIQDITDQKNLELESARSSYIMDKTSAIGRIGTWERNLVTGKISCNEMALQILEMETVKTNTINENLDLYKAGASRKTIRAAINESIHSGKHFDVEVEIIVSKTRSKWIRVIGQTEFNNGIATTLYGLFMEIEK